MIIVVAEWVNQAGSGQEEWEDVLIDARMSYDSELINMFT